MPPLPAPLPLTPQGSTVSAEQLQEVCARVVAASQGGASAVDCYMEARAGLAALFDSPVSVAFSGVEGGRPEVLVKAVKAGDRAFVSGGSAGAVVPGPGLVVRVRPACLLGGGALWCWCCRAAGLVGLRGAVWTSPRSSPLLHRPDCPVLPCAALRLQASRARPLAAKAWASSPSSRHAAPSA